MNHEAIDRLLHDDAPRVVIIRVERHVMKNNNYLVVDPGTRLALLVDPAWQIEEIHAAIAREGATLAGVLLTHSHFDHIDLAGAVSAHYGCPVWMSEQEIKASRFSLPNLVPIGARPWRVGGMLVEPILTPGHTPGCVCYLIGDNLFTGDVLFAEGCGICNGVDAAYAMYDSLELLKARLLPHTRIYPGHTYYRPPGQRFSDVLNNNMYLHFPDRYAFSAFRLRKGQSERKLLNFV
jgi:hydroxyacylglutathione hydrolase